MLLMILYLSPVPSPMVTVSPIQSMLLSGSSLSLICSIQPHNSVNTPTNVMYSWDAPNNTSTVNTVDNTSVLMISSVVTSDSGDYNCSVTLTDSTDSMYIIDSEPDTTNASVIVSK